MSVNTITRYQCSWCRHEYERQQEASVCWRKHDQAFSTVRIAFAIGDRVTYQQNLGDPDGCGPYTRGCEAIIKRTRNDGVDVELLLEQEDGFAEWVRAYNRWDTYVVRRCVNKASKRRSK